MLETEGIICARTRAGERLVSLRNEKAAPFSLFNPLRSLAIGTHAHNMQTLAHMCPHTCTHT